MLLFCSLTVSAQYNIEIGSYEYLSLDPPAGWVRNAYWTCDEGLTLTEHSEVGAVVKVTHYFSGAAYVKVSYTYEYVGSYDGNMHAGSSSKTYRITCIGGTASISESNVELTPGQTHTLKCTRSKSYGTPKWTSSDEDVVKVDKNGKLKAIASGVATITLDPITAPPCFCNVRVQKIDPTGIEIKPEPVYVVVGKTKKLTPEFSPSGASSSLDWTSEDTFIATVSSSGIVEGISVGKTTITATTENGLTAKATVEVLSAPTSVSLPDDIEISVGYYYTLTPELTPENTETSYTWKTSDSSVATVTSAGKIYGKKEGVVTITVTTDNKLSATTTVRIVEPVKGTDTATSAYRLKTINNLLNKIAK